MVKIRLSRFGSKHNPHYRIVVADARRPRDGGYIESVGHYDPRKTTESYLKVDVERARYWLARGAQPTDTARRLLRSQGVFAAQAPAAEQVEA
ncbi:30S ribosomal protein S16 [Deinococcus yavapaiensis]|uniref:Small ribosomal subunit protein bS16 n=1 Tax=Deinococcus yavapaiensis KR-236 TaxID=694435 RepID=A0A318S5N5_9DEIO|nr:30S ribosomal protein S16 [Deinococcus yavapaiensis]PYE48979.1 SSU ribosomal protein S16P [Deinococcus yavapaiensis KR-236]